MHDLFLIQRYYSQTEFIAYQVIQMIQTISQNRSDRKITATDLRNIYSAATLSIYPINDFSNRSGGHKLGHFPEFQIFYVKGNSDGTASVIWSCTIHMWNYKMVISSPSAVGVRVDTPGRSARSVVNIATNVDPKIIYPKLSMTATDKKIIVETKICYSTSSAYCFDNGVACNKVSSREALGLYLVSPKGLKNNSGGSSDYGYFNSVVIFSPNPNLFTDTAPS